LEVFKEKLSLWQVPKEKKMSRRMKTSRTTVLYSGQSKILNSVSFWDETWFTLSKNIHNLLKDFNINGSPQAFHEVHFNDLTISWGSLQLLGRLKEKHFPTAALN
jgi:hypothetical protein